VRRTRRTRAGYGAERITKPIILGLYSFETDGSQCEGDEPADTALYERCSADQHNNRPRQPLSTPRENMWSQSHSKQPSRNGRRLQWLEQRRRTSGARPYRPCAGQQDVCGCAPRGVDPGVVWCHTHRLHALVDYSQHHRLYKILSRATPLLQFPVCDSGPGARRKVVGRDWSLKAQSNVFPLLEGTRGPFSITHAFQSSLDCEKKKKNRPNFLAYLPPASQWLDRTPVETSARRPPQAPSMRRSPRNHRVLAGGPALSDSSHHLS